MLVLSRKANQRIMIGENIELIVVAVNSDRVKIGFNAPSEVRIHREEVYRRIQSEDGTLAPDANLIGDDRGTGCNDQHLGDLATTSALAVADLALADLRQTKET